MLQRRQLLVVVLDEVLEVVESFLRLQLIGELAVEGFLELVELEVYLWNDHVLKAIVFGEVVVDLLELIVQFELNLVQFGLDFVLHILKRAKLFVAVSEYLPHQLVQLSFDRVHVRSVRLRVKVVVFQPFLKLFHILLLAGLLQLAIIFVIDLQILESLFLLLDLVFIE